MNTRRCDRGMRCRGGRRRQHHLRGWPRPGRVHIVLQLVLSGTIASLRPISVRQSLRPTPWPGSPSCAHRPARSSRPSLHLSYSRPSCRCSSTLRPHPRGGGGHRKVLSAQVRMHRAAVHIRAELVDKARGCAQHPGRPAPPWLARKKRASLTKPDAPRRTASRCEGGRAGRVYPKTRVAVRASSPRAASPFSCPPLRPTLRPRLPRTLPAPPSSPPLTRAVPAPTSSP
mmetsp:Transcript_4914/g.16196  ORF Transcript_4914/g.16196 Transcript_4914/m.16196 type:complete len:229 (-) Transcript_4914:33-719(-)